MIESGSVHVWGMFPPTITTVSGTRDVQWTVREGVYILMALGEVLDNDYEWTL